MLKGCAREEFLHIRTNMDTQKGTAKECAEHVEGGCQEHPPYAEKGVLSHSLERFIDDEAREVEEDEDSASSSSSSESGDNSPKLKRSNAWIAMAGDDEGLPNDPVNDGSDGFRRWSILAAPDVGEYLAYFRLSNENQIAVCRTWANYLAAKNRPKKYLKAKK